ncbi:MAG TPA: heat-shock protein, partial [Bacteroidales bacterium]|nr:heat-shock protein [Bacteroidales bacterium]
MSLVRFSNLYPSVFDRFFENDLFDWSNRNFSNTNTSLPTVNIKESTEAFEVEMAAPGLGKGDFKIDLNNQVLTISSEKRTENETKEGQQFTRRE